MILLLPDDAKLVILSTIHYAGSPTKSHGKARGRMGRSHIVYCLSAEADKGADVRC